MSTFHLKVLTTERSFYDGEVDRIIVRTTQGDVGILPGHVPYTAALGIGGLTVIKDGEERVAAVSGGFVDVSKEQTVVLARTCEWADEIDINRAREAAERARLRLQQQESDHEQDLAQIKLKKAVNRLRIAEDK
ncbi:ATP synthase F1 subunit epsilon [Agathobaculum sp.]|uniref:ATP synthase F1 subunit epsilon n=1 Tax=Agathobaculum sp. TaxID=2048138 RepID=UPI002A83C9DD|nr:ATP synthase F1 subunit epsilon [Agathobaculum sp.]MDY3618813.1 ATP synthase F1 subunit epsilon [Agathobaculum sp.]